MLSPGAWFRGLLARLPLPLSVAAVGPEAGAGCAGFVSLGFRHGFWLKVFRADGQLSPHGAGGQGVLEAPCVLITRVASVSCVQTPCWMLGVHRAQ